MLAGYAPADRTGSISSASLQLTGQADSTQRVSSWQDRQTQLNETPTDRTGSLSSASLQMTGQADTT